MPERRRRRSRRQQLPEADERAAAPDPKIEGGQYRFRLFVAGNELNSTQAVENLMRLCKVHLDGRYAIDIIDVFQDFQTALAHGVLVTPTLLMDQPLPPVRIVGNLSDTARMLTALRLAGEQG